MTHIRLFLIKHYKITIFLFVIPSLLILAQNIGYNELGTIKSDILTEISGMVAGRTNPGILWVQNDSGDKSNFYAIDKQGNLLAIYSLTGAENRDWEDMAAGPGPIRNTNYIYLADIGDNDAEYPVKYVYRVPEPVVPLTSALFDTALSDWSSMAFTYPDGPRDAECLLVDPDNADIYVLSKRDAQTHVYYAPYPQPIDSVFEIQMIGTIPVKGITAGDISVQGDYIILKNYTEVYLWHHLKNKSIFETISNPPELLPYIPEPQGEAITWDPSGNGYLTTSEVLGGIPARLIFYNFVPKNYNSGGE